MQQRRSVPDRSFTVLRTAYLTSWERVRPADGGNGGFERETSEEKVAANERSSGCWLDCSFGLELGRIIAVCVGLFVCPVGCPADASSRCDH